MVQLHQFSIIPLLLIQAIAALEPDTATSGLQKPPLPAMADQEGHSVQAMPAAEEEARSPEEEAQEDHSDDEEPMVYHTPVDYAAHARQHREELLQQGKQVILQSELPSHIPRLADESPADYTTRYVDKMNEFIRSGVMILNDMTTADVQPNGFMLDGHTFDVGPNSGITKGEYRKFGEWLAKEGVKYENLPERFLRFEVPEGTEISYDVEAK